MMKVRPATLVGSAWLALAGLTLSCDDEDAAAPTDPAATAGRGASLEGIVAGAIVPSHAAFVVAAEGLLAAAEAHLAAGGDDAASLDALRAAWHAAMDAWQVVEPMQVGPAAPSLRDAKGQDLRDQIYSWPTTNPCRIDQELVDEGYAAAGFFDLTRVNVYGLDTLEHLLYRREAANACPPQVRINSEGSWAALDAAALNTRRAAYARAVAAQLVTSAQALDAAWRAEGAGFGAQLASGAAYGGVQASLDAVFAGLFYLDKQIKDAKLGVPLSIALGCPTDTCPDKVESFLAGRGRDNLLANLRGVRLVFTGGEGQGFDDLLVAEGAAELSTRMLDHIDAALAAVEAIPGDLAAAVRDEHPSVPAAHAAIRVVTDDLKSDFVTTLNLALPAEGAADND